MIISKKGFLTISGSVSELMADLGVIVDALNTQLSEEYSGEEAKKMITEAVEMGFESEEENEARLEKAKQEVAKKITKIILKGLV